MQQLRAEDPDSGTPEEPAARTAQTEERLAESADPSKSLQDEIEEFMNRDGGALAPDLDSES